MKAISKFNTFVKEVKIEMKKVSWSTKQELVDSTLVVILGILFLVLFIWCCDFFISKVIRLVIG